MDIFVGVIVGLLVLMLLVTAHEFGHFLAARRNGVRVLEFGIGFPPRGIAWVKDPETKKWHRLPRAEWGKPQKGLIFSLNFLPIGGFCQMDGESANDKRKGTFGHAKFSAKTKILFAGVAMNWLLAFIILTILAWTGMPTFLENQFTMQNDEQVSGKTKYSTNLQPKPPACNLAITSLRLADKKSQTPPKSPSSTPNMLMKPSFTPLSATKKSKLNAIVQPKPNATVHSPRKRSKRSFPLSSTQPTQNICLASQ